MKTPLIEFSHIPLRYPIDITKSLEGKRRGGKHKQILNRIILQVIHNSQSCIIMRNICFLHELAQNQNTMIEIRSSMGQIVEFPNKVSGSYMNSPESVDNFTDGSKEEETEGR